MSKSKTLKVGQKVYFIHNETVEQAKISFIGKKYIVVANESGGEWSLYNPQFFSTLEEAQAKLISILKSKTPIMVEKLLPIPSWPAEPRSPRWTAEWASEPEPIAKPDWSYNPDYTKIWSAR